MKRLLFASLTVLLVAACSEKDDTWNPYDNWAERNAAWYAQVADSARTAILKAQQLYGQQWQDHCQWRMLQSTTIAPDVQGPVTDSICLKYINRSASGDTPLWSDTVRINYRGFLMPTTDRVEGELKEVVKVFDQSFYGQYDPATAYPSTMLVSSTVPGFATALQHMRVGDEVMVYIPQQLAYGSSSSGSVPAYSALRFHLALMELFHVDEKVTEWQ